MKKTLKLKVDIDTKAATRFLTDMQKLIDKFKSEAVVITKEDQAFLKNTSKKYTSIK